MASSPCSLQWYGPCHWQVQMTSAFQGKAQSRWFHLVKTVLGWQGLGSSICITISIVVLLQSAKPTPWWLFTLSFSPLSSPAPPSFSPPFAPPACSWPGLASWLLAFSTAPPALASASSSLLLGLQAFHNSGMRISSWPRLLALPWYFAICNVKRYELSVTALLAPQDQLPHRSTHTTTFRGYSSKLVLILETLGLINCKILA